MAKVRIAFDFDLHKIAPDANIHDVEAAAREILASMLLHPLRRQANARNIEIRKSDLPFAEKQRLMAEQLRISMLTLSAESNMQVEVLPEDQPILTSHPSELAA